MKSFPLIKKSTLRLIFCFWVSWKFWRSNKTNLKLIYSSIDWFCFHQNFPSLDLFFSMFSFQLHFLSFFVYWILFIEKTKYPWRCSLFCRIKFLCNTNGVFVYSLLKSFEVLYLLIDLQLINKKKRFSCGKKSKSLYSFQTRGIFRNFLPPSETCWRGNSKGSLEGTNHKANQIISDISLCLLRLRENETKSNGIENRLYKLLFIWSRDH